MDLIREHRPRDIPERSYLVLPDNDQTYTLEAHEFRRRTGGQRYRVYRWSGICAVCGAEFETITKSHFDAITRTCPEHRRTWRCPRPEGERKTGGPRTGPGRVFGSNEQAALKTLEALSVASPKASVEDVIALCTPTLPQPKGRDTRRQSIVRALHNLGERKALGGALRDGVIHFD